MLVGQVRLGIMEAAWRFRRWPRALCRCIAAQGFTFLEGHSAGSPQLPPQSILLYVMASLEPNHTAVDVRIPLAGPNAPARFYALAQ